MSLPFTWPQAPSGEGRLLEIASFRKSKIDQSRFDQVFSDCMKMSSKFPISRQNLYGDQTEDPEIIVLVADWTSAEEKDIFEPGDEYQSIKPAFGQLVNSENTDFQCHHLVLPGSPKTTPLAGYYVVSKLRISKEHQDAVALAFQKLTESITDEDGLVFMELASSREDADVVVSVAGFKDNDTAEQAGTVGTSIKLKQRTDDIAESPAHRKLEKELAKYVGEESKYGAVLKPFT